MKKPIKITKSNARRIEAALAEVNGRASSFTTMYFSGVACAAEEAENRLHILPRAERVGAIAVHTPEVPTSRSYKYRAATTRLTMERRATGWFLLAVERDEVSPKQSMNLAISITPEQRDRIMQRSVEPFRIKQKETS